MVSSSLRFLLEWCKGTNSLKCSLQPPNGEYISSCRLFIKCMCNPFSFYKLTQFFSQLNIHVSSRSHQDRWQLYCTKGTYKKNSHLCNEATRCMGTSSLCVFGQTLPCLVRMCSKERLLEERVEGAETLAYLMEPDVELQRIASVTDHLVSMLADYFKYPSSVSAITDIKRVISHTHISLAF